MITLINLKQVNKQDVCLFRIAVSRQTILVGAYLKYDSLDLLSEDLCPRVLVYTKLKLQCLMLTKGSLIF